MGKTKHAKPEEHYLGRIRELSKEIKNLKREIKYLQRNNLNKPEKYKKEEKNVINCENCGKGELELFEIAGRSFVVCNLCKYRKKLM